MCRLFGIPGSPLNLFTQKIRMMENSMFCGAILLVLLVYYTSAQSVRGVTVEFKPSSITLQSTQNSSFVLDVSGFLTSSLETWWTYDRYDLIQPLPNLTFPAINSSVEYHYEVYSVGHAGQLSVGLESEELDNITNWKQAVLQISIVHSIMLSTFSDVVGWIYFVAWSISFYPQVIVNYRRKSVSGLSFDFLALNITGFVCYTIFNVGLFWIPEIQAEYYQRHPRGVIPVEVNDVFFAIHAVCLTSIQIGQCFIYESGGQKLFKVTIGGLALVSLASVILLILSATKVIFWLDYLYFFSYVKLGITLVKYIPQVWMNYRKKSTIGWSIGNVLLDFTGGTLSLAQLFIIAYNFDDWSSTVGNPTKIGLGLLSIFFDVVFIVQHYCLYRKHASKPLDLYEEQIDSESEDSEILT